MHHISRAIALSLSSKLIVYNGYTYVRTYVLTELNDSNVSEVTEDCLSNASNEADQTTVNRHN